MAAGFFASTELPDPEPFEPEPDPDDVSAFLSADPPEPDPEPSELFVSPDDPDESPESELRASAPPERFEELRLSVL